MANQIRQITDELTMETNVIFLVKLFNGFSPTGYEPPQYQSQMSSVTNVTSFYPETCL